MPPCVQYDDLWPGGPRFARSGAGFALGTDSVLLADFAADRRVRRFADLKKMASRYERIFCSITINVMTRFTFSLEPDTLSFFFCELALSNSFAASLIMLNTSARLEPLDINSPKDFPVFSLNIV